MNEGCMIAIFFVGFIAMCIGINVALDTTACSHVGKALNYKTEWHYFTGCVVTKPDGSRALLRQLRSTER
jgi:hypothetical protein